MPIELLYHHVNMRRHNAPGSESVMLSVVVQQAPLHVCGMNTIGQQTTSVPAVEFAIRPIRTFRGVSQT